MYARMYVCVYVCMYVCIIMLDCVCVCLYICVDQYANDTLSFRVAGLHHNDVLEPVLV